MPGATSTQSTRRTSPRASKLTGVWRDTVGCTGLLSRTPQCGGAEGQTEGARTVVPMPGVFPGSPGATSILTQPRVPSTLLVPGGDIRAQLWDKGKCR